MSEASNMSLLAFLFLLTFDSGLEAPKIIKYSLSCKLSFFRHSVHGKKFGPSKKINPFIIERSLKPGDTIALRLEGV